MSLALQPDDKILAGGYLNNGMGVARYTASGVLDANFGVNGFASTGTGIGERAMALQPDGKIVVLGDQFDSGTSQFFLKLARFNSDGTLDTTFGNGGIDDPHIAANGAALALQSDGKIVAVGTDYVTQGIFTTGYPVVARFNPDGYLDQSFGSGGDVFVNDVGTTREATSVAIQPNGQILVGGDFTNFGTSFMVLRFNPDGSRDYAWGNGGVAQTSFGGNAYSFGMALQPDGMVVLAGAAGNGVVLLARYTTTGGPDTTFGSNGAVETNFGVPATAAAIALQRDGQIVLAGNTSQNGQDFLVARYNHNGSLDSTFGSGGWVHTDFGGGGADNAHAVLIQPDSKIIAAGLAANNYFGLARYVNGSWSEFAMNPQHTAESTIGSQALQAIRWQTPVDLNPQYNGNDLLIHYGSPVITPSNTIIVPVKTGASGGFEVEGINAATGNVLWTQTTDYILPPHNWTPSYSPALTSQNRLYFAGVGGTLYYLDNPDGPGPHSVTQVAFYGVSNYNANPSAYNNTIYIDTPLTADSQGNIFFGFRVTGSNPSGLSSGIARIGADGSGLWVSATTAAGDTNIGEVPHNMAPALSNDQSTLYVGVRSSSTSNYGYLLGLDSTTLATKYNSGVLMDPRNTGNAGLLDDSTASPMVGPDGDVYYGVMGNPYNGSRGFMLHFSSDLQTKKTPGAFGWDDTASVVPASAVPSYTGSSSYLIFTKYNDYVAAEVGGTGGAGDNKIAILDPDASQTDPHPGDNSNILVMKEILTIVGPTPDTEFVNEGYPNAVREWCINSAAVDPITHSVFANSEDGKLYRWDLDTNTLSEAMTLTPGIGEAYTTTLIGPDGTVYATNNATLFAIDAANHFSISAPVSATAGSPFSITVTALDSNNQMAVGYTGTIHFSSSDMNAAVSLPADYTFLAADAGIHTFTNGVTLATAGSQTITATDSANNSVVGAATVNVSPAATASFIVTGYPSPVTAGSSNSFTVTAKDAFGNTTPNYTGTVMFSTSAAKAVLPANYTFTSGDAGVHMFSATLRSAGTQSITSKDTANSSISGSQSGIVVNAAAPFKLAIARFPNKPTAGVAGSFRVTAQDMFGNTTPSFTDTVHFTSSDPKAVLPANYTFTGADAGVHDFMATLKTAGSQSITVQDVTSPAIVSATQSNIVIQPAAASRLTVTGFPSSVITGTAHNFTVTALDPYDNVATGYRGTVTFSSSDNQAMLPANYSFISGDAGARTFSATLNSQGTQSITATDTVNAGITGTETGISVVSMQPTATVSGPSPALAVPGQPVSYIFSASEPGPATTFTYSIDWGDGSSKQSLPGGNGSPILTSHGFILPGTFAVSVTATDSGGTASLPATAPPVSISTIATETDPSGSGQALYLGGTTAADTIAITPAVRTVNGNLDYGVKVGMNMVNYGSFFSVSRVVVYGQAGADIIKTAAQTINGVFTNVSVPVMFFSGGDNDILNLTGSGSNAGTAVPNNVLVGGGGADRLIGGPGRDILIGGAGLSTLQAGSGGDILIGGTTAFDNKAAALAAILAEWSRTDISYTARMDHLTGKASGGLNGNYLLITKMGNANTVFDNGLADNLQGGAGMEWYFAGMADVFINKTPDEIVTPI